MADQEKRVYSFKAVGETLEKRDERLNEARVDLPIGVKTPVRLSQKSSEIFEMHTNLKDQIRDNFRNMLSTNHGERLMLSDFGANLLPLVFELGKEEFDTLALERISTTTQKYMPYVELETYEPFRETSQVSGITKVGIRVSYSVPTLNIRDQVIETVLHVAG